MTKFFNTLTGATLDYDDPHILSTPVALWTGSAQQKVTRCVLLGNNQIIINRHHKLVDFLINSAIEYKFSETQPGYIELANNQIIMGKLFLHQSLKGWGIAFTQLSKLPKEEREEAYARARVKLVEVGHCTALSDAERAELAIPPQKETIADVLNNFDFMRASQAQSTPQEQSFIEEGDLVLNNIGFIGGENTYTPYFGSGSASSSSYPNWRDDVDTPPSPTDTVSFNRTWSTEPWH
jgi:hypothetical protein